MTGLLARHPRRSTRADWQRLVVGFALVLAMSVAWRALRPAVIHTLACSSVGSHRLELLSAALQAQFPGSYMGEYDPMYAAAGPGAPFLTWGLIGWEHGPVSTWFFVDGKLRRIGMMRASDVWITPPGDWERDGHPELLVLVSWPPVRRSSIILVRVRPAANEVVAILDEDIALRPTRPRSYPTPTCVDEDRDGVSELVLHSWSRGPARFIQMPDWPDQLVAIFDWTAPGGILTPRLLPDDGTIRLWPLPDNQPVVFDPNEPLETVVARLRPPDTQPASLPATAPGPGL